MRKVVVTEFLTLDGVMEDPNLWSFPFWNDDLAAFKTEEMDAADALLLGRVTYEGFAAAWPNRDNADPFTNKMNTYPKHVATRTLKTLEWNNSHVIEGDLVSAVQKLKEQQGKNLIIHGSATLVQTLAAAGLIDEYRLLVFPVVRGEGKRLFGGALGEKSLTLTSARPLGEVVAVTYSSPSKGAK